MARRHNKTAKTFQQRQAERRQREKQETTNLVEEMASHYSCSVGIARDFAEQCTLRLDDLDFDLACNQLALDFWSSAPAQAQPIVDLLREIAAERQRHADALASIRERLQQLSDGPLPPPSPAPSRALPASIRDRLELDAKWNSVLDVERDISEYIDGFYNSQRRHSHNQHLSPIDFERQFAQQGIAA